MAPKSKTSPHRPPDSPLAAFVWRRKMWIETTFALSMLEPWEKLLLVCAFATLLVLFLTGFYKYLPHHVYTMHRRARFYLLGQDAQGLGLKARAEL